MSDTSDRCPRCGRGVSIYYDDMTDFYEEPTCDPCVQTRTVVGYHRRIIHQCDCGWSRERVTYVPEST